MRLKKLSLKNFRNYKNIEVNIDSDLVLILGENASGKTNLLESIYFLSNLKSFRLPDYLLSNYTEDFFAIEGRTGNKKLEIVVQTKLVVKRAFKIDGVKIKRFDWEAPSTVLFEPSDLDIFALGPSQRRKFLNQTLSSHQKSYAADLVSLEHILKQRTALLQEIGKNLANASQLAVWNEQMAEVSIKISQARAKFIDFLNQEFGEVYLKLTGFIRKFLLVYKGLAPNTSREKFLEMQAEYLEAEIRSGLNLFGPHRDDLVIEQNGLLNTYNSSRGELRAQVLALKLLQAKYLTKGEDKPIILLDDVFSELDEIRRTKLLENLAGHQVFITTTEEHHLPQFKQDFLIIKIKDNKPMSSATRSGI